jgi:DMSO/TMAO reductase YedYZ molybdopterin-dependent catalytic subunit
MASPQAQPTPTPTPALPPPGTFILVNGMVANPAFVTLDQLQRMRSTSLTMRVAGRGVMTVTGAPLAAVLDLVNPTVTGGTTTSTRAYALVSGLSGQPAIVAFPEFERAFAGKQVLLAYLVNGRAVKPGAAMLVVQGDATAGRFVEGVTHVQVFEATPSP